MSRSINGVSAEHMKVFAHNHVGGLSVVVAPVARVLLEDAAN